MRALQTIARHLLPRGNAGQSSRLWPHFGLALGAVLMLLITVSDTGGKIATVNARATDAIQNTTAQIVTGHEILTLADQLAADAQIDSGRLDDLILQFAEAQQVTNTRAQTSRMSAEYVQQARRLAIATPVERRNIATNLHDIFENQGLRTALADSAARTAANANSETERLRRMQRTLLTLIGAVILIETLGVLLPRQIGARAMIDKLRKQATSLQRSRAQLQHANKQLEQLASHDPLTGLPNRNSLTHYMKKAMMRKCQVGHGVLLVGLDDFNGVNDTAGYAIGDELLTQVATLLRNCIDDENIVGRVGCDDFLLMTEEPPADVAKRILASFSEPFEVMGRRIPITSSIGYLEITAEDRDPLNMLANAGLALQSAKKAGGHAAHAYTPDLRSDIEHMQRIQGDLAAAIQNGEIEPWFQPQIRLTDGTVHGVEVLARWQHPTMGLLNPVAFLPAAERAGLTVELDHAIWRQAMQHAQGWQAEKLWYPRISLNAAPDTLSDPYLIERVLLHMQRTGLTSDQVVIEVLETTLINGSDDMAFLNIDSLAECGIALELDDFGTGYASLSRLTQLPVAGIKLDRSLVAPLPDPRADSILRALLALATELDLHVIAEGVEDETIAAHLNMRGCLLGQGYGFARPMPGDDFTAWLSENGQGWLPSEPNIVQLPNRA